MRSRILKTLDRLMLAKGDQTMKMTVIEHRPEDTAFDGSAIPPRVKSPTTFEESGWQSVKEMQRELIRRFPHDGPKKITNRIMYTTLSYGRTMFVTLHD